MARKTGSFQQHYLVTLARQQGGGGAAAWAAADHEHVSGQVWGVRLDHCHTFGYFSLALWARGHRVQGGARNMLYALISGAPFPDPLSAFWAVTGAASRRVPVAGSTSKGPGSSSSCAMSRIAGMTSSPMSRRLRIASSCVMAPSPSQKKMLPGRMYSRTCRILGRTVFGVPEMIV